MTVNHTPLDQTGQTKGVAGGVKTTIILFFSVIAGLGLILIVLSLKQSIFLKNQSPPSPSPVNYEKINQPSSLNQPGRRFKQWIDCSDARQIIEEDNLLYVACYGGVLVVDKTTGLVQDQISMTQGLGNEIATSLVKKDNELFIGSQDGFARFNLTTRQAQKISVKEGLISGANINLTLDGNNLWVATFEGLSLYNIATGTIKNFTTELIDNTTSYDVTKIATTPSAGYVVLIASAYSRGGIARFDKMSQTWEKFGVGAFVDNLDQYSRVDFFGLAAAGNYVYAMEGNHVWQIPDSAGQTWQKLPGLPNQALNSNRTIFSSHNKLYLINNNQLYFFDQTANAFKKVLLTTSQDNQKINLEYTFPSNGNLFINQNLYQNSSVNKPWLAVLNLDTLTLEEFNLNQRPTVFTDILAVIDNKPILCADNKIWQYDGAKDEFIPRANIECNEIRADNLSAFVPIANTSTIFIYFQPCGMGCDPPRPYLWHYDEDTIQTIELPKTLGLPQDTSLFYDGNDGAVMNFHFDGAENERYTLSLDTNSRTWTTPTKTVRLNNKTASQTTITCNKLYAYELNNNVFNQVVCPTEPETNDVVWTVEKTNQTFSLVQKNKHTSELTTLTIPFTAPLKYSPFDNFETTTLKSATVYNEKLIVATNRGLYIYDPRKLSWRSFTTREGLVSNNISHFMLNNNTIWAITSGFSAIVY